MELVDGDAESPTLISNIEVMQLLKKNIDARSKQSGNKKKNSKRNKIFRHRDWVEGEVYQYLANTPCVKLEPNKREEFYSKLKGNKKLRRSSELSKSAAVETDAMDEDAKPQGSSTGFDLTEAEALQIMNMMPTEPVEIHLMVDELQSRMSEERQEEFLSCIATYSTGSAEALATDVPKTILANGDQTHENGNRRAIAKQEDVGKSTGII